MVSRGDCSIDVLFTSDRPVLLDGLLRRRHVIPATDIDIVCAVIAGNFALLFLVGRGIIVAKRFHHVVLNEGRGSPSIKGKITIAVRAIGARVFHISTPLSYS
jgi:hypothetical protein